MVNQRSLQNLRPYRPGQSGNPAGRRKGGVNLTSLLRQALEKDDHKLAKRLVKTAIDRAIAGDFQFLREIWNRIDGKVPSTVHAGGSVWIRDSSSWPDNPRAEFREWRDQLPDVIYVDLPDDPPDG